VSAIVRIHPMPWGCRGRRLPTIFRSIPRQGFVRRFSNAKAHLRQDGARGNFTPTVHPIPLRANSPGRFRRDNRRQPRHAHLFRRRSHHVAPTEMGDEPKTSVVDSFPALARSQESLSGRKRHVSDRRHRQYPTPGRSRRLALRTADSIVGEPKIARLAAAFIVGGKT